MGLEWMLFLFVSLCMAGHLAWRGVRDLSGRLDTPVGSWYLVPFREQVSQLQFMSHLSRFTVRQFHVPRYR